MQRLLLVVIVLYLAWRIATIVGRHLQRSARGADDFSRFRRPREDARGEPESLVECSGCGTMLPYSRSLPGPAGSYCSPECRERGGERGRAG